MKVCELCSVDFPMVHFLLPLMEAIRAEGHEVVGVVADGPLLARVRERGFRVETVPFRRDFGLGGQWRAYRALVALFRRERFDVVHTHTPIASLIARAAAWRTGVPRVVYTVHGFVFHEHMAWPFYWAALALEWLAGRVTDTMLSVSEEDAATARRFHLCRGDVHVVRNGVDPARYGPADAATRRRLRAEADTPEDAVVIAAVGRLIPEKGFQYLLPAIPAVEDAVFWIVGRRLDSDRAGVEAAIRALEADRAAWGRVRFLGYRDDVAAVLSAADIFCLPSIREGLPVAIIEAMMSALPVVSTDARGPRELVVDGETGLLVPVRDPSAIADALSRLVADPDLRRRLGAAGRRRAERHFDKARTLADQVALLGLARAQAA